MGLVAKQRELNVISYKVKTYLARGNPGIDYLTIIDKMFLNKYKKNYIYTLSKETQYIVRISYLQDKISLSNTLLLFLDYIS